MNIGRVGIWSMALEAQPLSVAQEAAAELDELGFPALWIPEALGKEVMSHAALLLAATRRMVVATGIANLWARDATAMVNAQRTLTEGFPERFLLGIGVSHTPTVALRGHTLVSPVQATRDYLAAMDATRYFGAVPAAPLHRVLAALGPRMLTLAAELTEGAHTYTVPVEHTEQARRRLGPGPLLIPEQKVVLVSDPGRGPPDRARHCRPSAPAAQLRGQSAPAGLRRRRFRRRWQRPAHRRACRLGGRRRRPPPGQGAPRRGRRPRRPAGDHR